MTESVYLLSYIQKSIFSIANRLKANPLLETFRIFLIKVKFTSGSQDALFMKIGVPTDKIKQNHKKYLWRS